MRWVRSFIKSRSGSATIEFLVIVPMMCVLSFYPIMTYTMQHQRYTLDSIKDRYLQHAQIAGGFTPELWAALQSELKSRKFDQAQLAFDGSTPVGTTRARGELIVLNIGYPQGTSQAILSLIGLQPPDPNTKMWEQGSIVSEKRP